MPAKRSKGKPEQLEELVAHIRRVIFVSDDRSYVVAILDDGRKVAGNTNGRMLSEDCEYLLLGSWKETRHGLTFQFHGATLQKTTSTQGLIIYLARNLDGIGPARAEVIVDTYGDRAIKVLTDDPEKVARDIRGISSQVARAASEKLRSIDATDRVRIALLGLLNRRGFPKKTVELCIGRWGAAAADIVARDPFKLITARFRGAGFLRCDQFYRAMGLPSDRLKRAVLCIWHALVNHPETHTWFPIAHVTKALRDASIPSDRAERAIAAGVRARWFDITEVNGQKFIADRRYAQSEHSVARSITELMAVGRDCCELA